jgi:hypothetical protein
LEVLEENEWTQAKYRPFCVEWVSRKLDPPMLYDGRKIHRYNAARLVVCDMETGELFRVVGMHYAERSLQREYVLNTLRAQTRHFACFVLKFRNYRRGTTPELNTLVRWYAELFDLRPDNVRRYVPRLKTARVIESDTLMGRLFQISSASMHPDEFLGEEWVSRSKFDRMSAQKEALKAQRAEYVGVEESVLQKLVA